MGEMLTLQVTIFSVMAIGFLLKKIKLISARGQKEITDLVINLILPANIITSFMTEPRITAALTITATSIITVCFINRIITEQ